MLVSHVIGIMIIEGKNLYFDSAFHLRSISFNGKFQLSFFRVEEIPLWGAGKEINVLNCYTKTNPYSYEISL